MIGQLAGGGKYQLYISFKDETGKSNLKKPKFTIPERSYGPAKKFDRSDVKRIIEKQNIEQPEVEPLNPPPAETAVQLSGTDIAQQVSLGLSQGIAGIIREVAPFAPAIISFLKPEPNKSTTEVMLEAERAAVAVVQNASAQSLKNAEAQTKATTKLVNDAIKDMFQTFSDNMAISNYINADNEQAEGLSMDKIIKKAMNRINLKMGTIKKAMVAGGVIDEGTINQIRNNPVFSQIAASPELQDELLNEIEDTLPEEVSEFLIGAISNFFAE